MADQWREAMEFAVQVAKEAGAVIREALKEDVSVMLKSSPADLVTATDQKVEFGVVYSCVEDKMYTGRKGKGAYCNGQKLQVSGQKDVTKSMIITELGSNRNPEIIKIVLSNMERLLCIPIHGIRAVGTAAVNMCLVASGGADAYYEMGIHCWDMAAAAVIVTEAGGVVLDAKGGPFDLMSCRVIAASSKEIGERISKELQLIPLVRDDGKKE
ncbi:hypothetical protein GDO78_012381 [Eleutherodactylus coqui]|uniref:Inositol-1-monophosphatase n=1 Tax=Eleutherodactylus coqui TaxID=57060 RepID=A0A8J6F0S9_ELECQ|nr:hypothetical protein GDO78_012381 [Eleutherodactylus coqui]